MDLSTYIILGVATAAKVVLFAYCFSLKGQSDSMMALAEDHSNDIISNLGARAEARVLGRLHRLVPLWVTELGCRRQLVASTLPGCVWKSEPQHSGSQMLLYGKALHHVSLL